MVELKKIFRKWTENEVKYLEEHYNDSREELVEYFIPRTWKSIIHKISNMGLPREKEVIRFSDEEIQILKDNYWMQQDILKLLPNRNWETVRKKIDELNLPRKKVWKYWSIEELDILSKCLTIKEAISNIPLRSYDNIYQKSRELDIIFSDLRHDWSEDEIELLINKYTSMSANDLSKLLNRSEQSIYVKANRLGLNSPNKRKDLKDNDILKYYIEEDLNCSQIAKLYGTSVDTISLRLRKLDISIRSRSYYSKSVDDFETLKEMRRSLNYRLWRDEVLERDLYTCQCCGSNSKLNAHHIYNFAEHETLRFELSNGLILCKDCHMGFHNTYGYTGNNQEQLDEFIHNYALKYVIKAN